MRTIRSLLWVGSGRGLSESGITEAPELDITWVPNLAEAEALPAIRFDAVLYEATAPRRITPAIEALARFSPARGALVSLTHGNARFADSILDAGASAVLVVERDGPGKGFVREINATLDALEKRETARPRAVTTGSDPTAREGEAEDRLADPTSRLIFSSRAMQEVRALIDPAAASPSTVLVTGETGVGKEVVARELHARSPRRDAPFLAINCAAFPESLLESELFGHVRGAFTGATRAKRGLFEAAEQGTLFLDEIAETSLSLQAKLLRVLQEREIRPVGETTTRAITCRIVAATNRRLADEVEQKRFREDLFYRLDVFPIRIPPLRERRQDIVPLARHFLALHGPREDKRGCHLSLAARHLLESYAWPGNVRELENEMLRALMVSSSGGLITPRQLSPRLVEILEPIAHGARPDESLSEALARIEAWMIRRALANNGGRRAYTARRLGLTREGLYKKMKRLGIE